METEHREPDNQHRRCIRRHAEQAFVSGAGSPGKDRGSAEEGERHIVQPPARGAFFEADKTTLNRILRVIKGPPGRDCRKGTTAAEQDLFSNADIMSMKILIIDDDHDNRHLLQEVLSLDGYEIVS